MDVVKAIKGRRSVRSFKEDKIKKEDVYECVDNAKYAPSSGNLQNWKVIVVEDKNKLKELAVACLRQRWIADAPVSLVVCAEMDSVAKVYGDKGELYAVENANLYVQNLILLLYSKGLGSALVGSFDKKAIRRILKIPTDAEPLYVIPVGKSNGEVKEPIRREMEHFTYFGEWGSREKNETVDLTKVKESIKEKSKPFYERLASFFKKKEESQ
jgi:nitroreductase